jgi:hypothetical protein
MSCFIVGVVLTGLLFLLRASNYSKRHSRVVAALQNTADLGGLNVPMLADFVLLAMHSWVLM